MSLVRTTPEADAQAHAADEWWIENRPSSPDLFLLELAGVLELLASAPAVGQRQREPAIPGLRRILMRQSRYHVYNVFDEQADIVLVLAVWSAVRGRQPTIVGP